MTCPELTQRCRDDGEFRLAVRHLDGGFRIRVGETLTGVSLAAGEPLAEIPEPGPEVIEISGNEDVWAPVLAQVPPPLAKALAVMVNRGLEVAADPVAWWQYLPGTERLIELLRAPGASNEATEPARQPGTYDTPVGRYVHVELEGHDYRLYYEQAGQGIPLLLQHTAGSHSLQWRHLFENPDITDHFQVIAYDLPFHGKSIPPVGRRWWEQEYKLTGDFLRQVPVALAEALGLERPAFMGCSVGGLLALDLALHHSDLFRAVVSVEGALRIGGDYESLFGMFHPQVASTAKARMMEGLCAPSSPVSYVKEISQVYSAGWPPVFVGDLWYYTVDYDLRERAHEIDTSRCAVHILNGEYDYTGSVERGRTAHEAIVGSTHTPMQNIGHFPMAENPDLFMTYLAPILDQVRSLPGG